MNRRAGPRSWRARRCCLGRRRTRSGRREFRWAPESVVVHLSGARPRTCFSMEAPTGTARDPEDALTTLERARWGVCHSGDATRWPPGACPSDTNGV